MKTYAEVLRALRVRQGYRQRDVARLLNEMGIEAANTQVSRWENGLNNPNIEQFIGLCEIYSVRDVPAVFKENDISGRTLGLNREGREKLEEFRQILIEAGRYAPAQPEADREPAVLEYPRRMLPVYDLRISAGTGQPGGADSYEMEAVPGDVPESATFGLIVSGDSMEPGIRNGERIWVHRQETLENGNIGVFYLDGALFVKEYRVSDEGVFLVSHNRAYPPIPINEYSTASIYGKVIYPFWR